MKNSLNLIVLFFFITFSCKDIKTSTPNKLVKNNSYNDTTIINKSKTTISHNDNIDKKWYGVYNTRFDYGKIGGMNAGWDLEIIINSEQIVGSGSGYQIGFKDEVTATQEGNKLVLKYKKNLDGYTLGESMNPEFILTEDNGSFYVQSEWIDSDIITKPEAKGFKISKEKQ
ncbi:hypothetical protein [Chryseobacterium jejuense]|uniref:Uncharacterized protein n=1 Tax=Chryseobacterium jejuense TaxID=445960 RepID=A0A2X2VIX8_CHRJE|nr:hypothetical protein [Chryseobacterium jejuense]SDJ20870.1 hypothetical protein SAMN05421542_3023 [Chryseobacterium jejuense]SQB28528.1 Uncharacterised protein [Chryseobacterium jejuense]